MRWLVPIIAVFQVTYRIVFFRVFTDAIFVLYLYCFYFMLLRENKNSGFSRLDEESRSFYMFCVVGEWRL